jgi:hypothetical protein
MHARAHPRLNPAIPVNAVVAGNVTSNRVQGAVALAESLGIIRVDKQAAIDKRQVAVAHIQDGVGAGLTQGKNPQSQRPPHGHGASANPTSAVR